MLGPRFVFFFSFVILGLCGTASAQTNIYGSLKCDPVAMRRNAPAGSKPTSKTVTSQQKCSWTQPLQINGSQTNDALSNVESTIDGLESHDTGDQVNHMVSGEQFTVHFSGTGILDSNGAPRSQQGTWTFTSGTGTLKGITGQGDYTGLRRAEGGMSYDVRGKYDIPKAP